MKRIRVIPVLLLKNGGLYKTVKFKNPNYVGDPINTVKIFNEKEVDELVVLDIGVSKDKLGPNYSKISEIAGEAFMPMAYGGGIKTLDDAKRVFDAGFEKIVLNTILFDNIGLIDLIGKVYGNQSVVACIDVKKDFWGNYYVYSNTSNTKKELPEIWAQKLEKEGAGELIIQSVDKDGTWEGYDLELIKKVSNAVSIPVIACGGAGNLNHLKEAAQKANASAVAVGSMFVYQKKGMGVLINYPNAKELVENIFSEL